METRVDIAASVEAALRAHPRVTGVTLAGSRARGTNNDFSDWDFRVVTTDFDAVAAGLPALVAELEPLAQQWDRLSTTACYMLLLKGPTKIDLLFDRDVTP